MSSPPGGILGPRTLVAWTRSLLSSSEPHLATPSSTPWPALKPPRYQDAPPLCPGLRFADSPVSGQRLRKGCVQRNTEWLKPGFALRGLGGGIGALICLCFPDSGGHWGSGRGPGRDGR